ncbi:MULTISPECIES: hypothetical protein [unclassified Agromyces]|uniref:hypothetical protein n=1 Tax=unclassified Agromyces TaxID=2639701 RepID=UPI0030155780
MSGAEFDPRYDPRYQRGWVEGPTDATAPAEIGPGFRPEPAVPSPEPASPRRARASDGPAGPPAPSPPDPPPARVAATPPPASHRPDGSDDPDGPAEPVGPAHPADPADSLDDPAARVVRIALGVAWAVAVGATLAGAGLVWSLASRVPLFSQPADSGEMVVQALAQYAAPSLLSTGLLGVVVLTVVDGLRRARDLAPARRSAGEEGGA